MRTVEPLRLMEHADVVVSQHDSILQLLVDQLLCLVHFRFGDNQRRQVHVVEFQLVAFHGLVAAGLYIGQHRGHRLVQFRHVQVRTLNQFLPFLPYGIFYYFHFSFSTLLLYSP